MTVKENPLLQFTRLTRLQLEEWAGKQIVSRGISYQASGAVSDLAVTADNDLLAWVQGTHRYATMVMIDDDGLPQSVCTCPYECDCKHGVAVVIEYAKQLQAQKNIPVAKPDDKRLKLIMAVTDGEDSDFGESVLYKTKIESARAFLQNHTKAQLIDLVLQISRQHPEVAEELADRQQLTTGDVGTLVKRLRRDIKELSDTADYYEHDEPNDPSAQLERVSKRLAELVKVGFADEALELGKELLTVGARLVEGVEDEGETAIEVADCMPAVVEALRHSTLNETDRLYWALDALLQSEYGIGDAFEKYLEGSHPAAAWSELADRLLKRLKTMPASLKRDDYTNHWQRDSITKWIMHTFTLSGRETEIIPLCEAEIPKTGNYDRLVDRLMAAKRLTEAEKWIKAGLQEFKDDRFGSSHSLRQKYLEIRRLEKNWLVVAALQVDEYVRGTSTGGYVECRKACEKAQVWQAVREDLLLFLEKDALPWRQPDWPLPTTGLDRPQKGSSRLPPQYDDLISIAILEKDPERVLYWYDRCAKQSGRLIFIHNEAVADAVKAYAPDRSVEIWKKIIEALINQVKPSAYEESVKYFKKMNSTLASQEKQHLWKQYLQELRVIHRRKIRLMEVLDKLEKQQT